MELSNQKRLANHIFRLLKVNEIVIPIGRTNKGNLGLKFTQNSDDFEVYLDAVPLSTKDMLADDNNIELKKMLEKYLFEDNKTVIYKSASVGMSTPVLGSSIQPKHIQELVTNIVYSDPKKRGRPAGAKNKVK